MLCGKELRYIIVRRKFKGQKQVKRERYFLMCTGVHQADVIAGRLHSGQASQYFTALTTQAFKFCYPSFIMIIPTYFVKNVLAVFEFDEFLVVDKRVQADRTVTREVERFIFEKMISERNFQ